MSQLFFHIFSSFPVCQWTDTYLFSDFQMCIVQIRERTFVIDDTPNIVWFIQFQRHVFLFAARSKRCKPNN